MVYVILLSTKNLFQGYYVVIYRIYFMFYIKKLWPTNHKHPLSILTKKMLFPELFLLQNFMSNNNSWKVDKQKKPSCWSTRRLLS